MLMIVGKIGTHFSLVRMTISVIMLLVLGKDVHVHVLPGSVSTFRYVVLRHCFSYVFYRPVVGSILILYETEAELKFLKLSVICFLLYSVFVFFFFVLLKKILLRIN